MDRTQYNIFVNKLQEIFMMDHAELDFGIYRIMNYKRDEINEFLTNKLLPQVDRVLKEQLKSVDVEDVNKLKQELQQAINFCVENGYDVETNKSVKNLREKISSSSATNIDDLQNVVFSRLTQFFSRYYKDGDFISLRRYKSNGDSAYMLPYNGEEVKLVWANQDQYYIKTSEYFKNYSFVLQQSRRKVHFVLKDASTEQNNNKNQNGMERRFALWKGENGEEPLTVVDGELEIYFTYELMPSSVKQPTLNAQALATMTPLLQEPRFANWSELLINAVKADRSQMDITWLQKHLNDYTAKNTFDYFIHKDLGGFLRRELDFFIKNEVLVVDDLTSTKMASQLAVIKAIEQVGNKIITFLAQLEDFQKKLWLKKKFVVGCDYCITLDRIPESMYPEIIANNEQRREWVRLFAIDEIKGDMMTEAYSEPLTIEFLKQNPFLVLDTKFFPLEFKHKLLATVEDIDGQCNGLLISSDNYQALKLLTVKYSQRVTETYIDPPYNTDATPILYKNSYKDSSWMTLMQDRFSVNRYLMDREKGVYSVAIDDTELHNLYKVMEQTLSNSEFFQCIVNHYPGSGTGRSNVSKTHEYNIFAIPTGKDILRGKAIEERTRTRSFSRAGTGDNNFRKGRPNSFYAVLVDDATKEIKGVETPPNLNDENYPKENTKEGYLRIYPIGNDGSERCWSLGYETAKEAIKNGMIQCTPNNTIIRLYNDEADWQLLPSIWIGKEFSAVTWGTNLLTKMFGDSGRFSFPKSLYTVETAVYAGTHLEKDAIVLDYFGGSGTTAHAVIDLNKKDLGTRKYILCEMGEYFEAVTKNRVEKAIYSSEWSNGKPTNRQGISQCFKYIRLEQYEDTLNNLIPKQSMPTEGDDGFQESYMLGYMLDTDTRGSLLNLKMFKRPFDVTIKTTKNNELEDTPVDMVETFNYLIGLNVETESWHHDGDICVVEGKTHIEGENALVIWRNCDKIDNDALNEFFRKQDFNTLDMEYDVIYVNGDNTLPNVRRDEDHWKVMLIEQEFKARMFEED